MMETTVNQKQKYRKLAVKILTILVGLTCYAIGTALFVLPSDMIAAGTTGLALLAEHYWGLPLSVFVAAFNVLMFLLGLAELGKEFALSTLIATFYYPFALDQAIRIVGDWVFTEDPMLCAIFAGLMIGFSLGIVIRAGASTGGMDIPPLVLRKRLGIPVSVSMYAFDFVILLTQLTFRDKEKILYGLIMVMIYTVVLDKVLMMGTRQMQVKIISERYEEISEMIQKKLDRGTTLLPSPALLEGEAALAAVKKQMETGRLDLLPAFEQGRLAGLWAVTEAGVAHVTAETAGSAGLPALLEGVRVRTHDSKPLHAALLREGAAVGVEMDTMLAGYLLNPLASGYALPRLAQEYGLPPAGEGEAEQAALLPPLAETLERETADQGEEWLLREVEQPLAEVLAAMENEGFAVDKAGIAAFGEVLQDRIDDIQRQITESVGYAFNLNSPKQLAKALFEDLGLPAKKKTKSGYSTNAEVLESLRDAHPAVEMLLDYRMLAKLKSTYCDGLLKVVGEDGRIHSSFNQTETRTGRISSTEPNLQNIPVRQELGRELRRFFIARKGWVLCDADYSQIELRVLAHMAGDPTMIEAFNSGEDIHRITASQVFGVPQELVTPLMRSRAKAVNFGIVYGIGAHSLSQDIQVSYGEAKRYIDDYLAHYSAVAGFMEDRIRRAKETGYAETLFGRRRPLPELKASNGVTRSFGERVARNMPIQGTAADIIKIAMVRVYRRLREEKLEARLILQVHDELLVEAPEAEAARVAVLLKEEMEAAAALQVKLEAEVHIGSTWYDAKG